MHTNTSERQELNTSERNKAKLKISAVLLYEEQKIN